MIDVSIANANTGASTLNVDGLGAKPIYGLALQPLQGGELVAKGVACFLYIVASTVNAGNGAWILMECAGGAQQVATASQSQHAVQFGQLTGGIGSRTNLKATCAANATTITFTADQLVVGTALNGLQYLLANYNQTLNLAVTGAGGMDTGTATAGGWLAVYAIYNPATNTRSIIGTMDGSSAAPTVYGGSNPASGYTASELLAVIPVSSTAGQLKACLVNGRRVSVPSLLTFQTSTTSPTPVSFSLSGAVPKAAVRASGIIAVASTSTSNVGMSIQSDSTTNALGVQNVSQSGGSSGTGAWSIDLATAQTLYYAATSSAGTPTFSLYVSGYEV